MTINTKLDPSKQGGSAPTGSNFGGAQLAGALTLLVGAAITFYQAVLWWRLYHKRGFLGAAEARPVLLLQLVLVTLVFFGGVLLPRRWARRLPLVMLFVLACVTVAVAVGSHVAFSILIAGLTLLAIWSVGSFVVRRAPAELEPLRAQPVAVMALGYVVFALTVFAFGRISALRWWTVGAPTVLLGALGLWSLMKRIVRRPSPLVTAATETRFSIVACCLLLIQATWAVIWAAAPEIQFDALAGKVWLPSLWARTGGIGFSLLHPVANDNGLGFIAAVPSHILGAHEAGRFLQYFLGIFLVGAVWQFGRNFGANVGPLVAVIVGFTPHLVWQMSTANDDLTLTLLVVGAAAAAIVLSGEGRRSWLPGLAVGFLAGGVLSGKLYLAVSAVAFALSWVALAGSRTHVVQRATGALFGGFLAAGPMLVGRWIVTRNPVFPHFNNIFKSPYYPPINEHLNLPYLATRGPRTFLRLPFFITAQPAKVMEAVPPGVFGLLLAALIGAGLTGWVGHRRAFAVWCVLVVSFAAWWWQLRYLRYLLPFAFLATLLVAPGLGRLRSLRAAAAAVMLSLAAAVVAGSFFASTVAAFWNVPDHVPVSVAFGSEGKSTYLRDALPAAQLAAEINRVASPGDRVVGISYTRSLFRSDIDWSPEWEFETLLHLHFPQHTSDPEIVRQEWARDGARLLALGTDLRVRGFYSDAVESLVRNKSQLVWADRGYELYKLTSAPSPGASVAVCDSTFSGTPACWGVPLGPTPGFTGRQSIGLGAQAVAACPGATYRFQLTTGSEGLGAELSLAVRGADGKVLGYAQQDYGPRKTDWLALTAPPGAARLDLGVRLLDVASSVQDVALDVTSGPTTCATTGA